MSIFRYTLITAAGRAGAQGDRAPMVRHVLVDAARLDRPGLPGAPAGAWFAPRERPADGLGQTGRFHARLPRATLSAMANGCPVSLALLR